jgi:NPCBM/NEW2 domain
MRRPSLCLIAFCYIYFFPLLIGFETNIAHSQSSATRNAPEISRALTRIQEYHSTKAVPAQRTLHIVYWTPKNREPTHDYRARLSRVFFDIRQFYRKEMIRLGLGDKTIPLAQEPDGLLKIHLVQGREPYANYNGKSGSKIRDECLPILEAAGIDAARETIVIFCNMSNWDPIAKKMSQNSPYYAGGGKRNGTAWQVDSALLDSKLLINKEPILEDGQYGRISVGKYNSIFVGGVCHELGHALGLPHNMERPDERNTLGTSLMGSGNRTYGDDRRKEGRGSFLTLADGLRLASHPLFLSSEKGIDLPASAEITDVDIKVAKDSKSFQFSGRVVADPPAYAVIGYIDPNGGGDYDAMTVTAIPDNNNQFVLPCASFKNGKAAELRIVVCQVHGSSIHDRELSIPFSVSDKGVVDLSSYIAITKLSKLADAVKRKDTERAIAELALIETSFENSNRDPLLVRVARSLTASIDFQPGPAPNEARGTLCWLSDSTSQVAKVGWLRPTINRLPDDSVLLTVNGQLFARGLYAHAPSTYTYELGGKWKRLTGFAGNADGHGGAVVFSIFGDGKELWRSKKPAESTPMSFVLNVTRVRELTFQVDDAGDGGAADWGVWADLKVERD